MYRARRLDGFVPGAEDGETRCGAVALAAEGAPRVFVCEGRRGREHGRCGSGGDGAGRGVGAGAVEVQEEGEEGGHQGVEDVERGEGGDGVGVEG